MPSLAKRLESVPASPIRKLVPYAQAAKKSGTKVYHLNIGDPDIKTPEEMIGVLKSWDKNPISYELSQGSTKFLEALTWYYHSLGFTFIETKNIQVTNGGSEAISMALFATCEPGDEVIVFEPFYANYNSYAALNGVKIHAITTTIESGFHLPSKKTIEKAINDKTKAILFCNPNNPTGTVYTKEEIEMLVDIATEHGLFLLSDEVYREYTYDGKTQVSLLSYMPKVPDQAIVLDSMSKRYSLCGARLGALVSLNPNLLAGVLRIAQGRLSSGFIDQAMASELVHVENQYIVNVQKEYELRRDALFRGLQSIPGVTVRKPEGAFYVIVGLPVGDSEAFCQWLLTDFRDQNETIMIAPAGGFYATVGKGKNEVRIAYVLNTKDLKRSIDLLRIALSLYNKTK
ncbi:pyridoxal phosphate-dependent aminotransferase [Candidatus Gottesmanbacteria bacterium]|nr:pyridoxal phosphate-dependent aminotransferase [Candidatus Gottesmanbacteria bacterium]